MALTIFDIALPPFHKKYAKLLSSANSVTLKNVISDIVPFCNDELCDNYLLASCNGRIQDLNSNVLPGYVYTITGKLAGGKGGFGSLLRAIGMQIERTRNREACRDLSGRRMRDVNNEKKLKEWFSQAAERMVEKDRRKRERRERLLQEPKITFDDQEYLKQKEQVIEDMEAALEAGMARARKRTGKQVENSENGGPSKKLRSIDSWAGVDISDLSSSSSDDDSDSDLDLPPPDLQFSDDEGELSEKAETSAAEAEKEQQKQPIVNTDEKGSEGRVSTFKKDSEEISKDSNKPVPEQVFDEIDLDKVVSVEQLAAFGLDHLKAELRRRNMKCGGTIDERVNRLWQVKFPPKVADSGSSSSKKAKHSKKK